MGDHSARRSQRKSSGLTWLFKDSLPLSSEMLLFIFLSALDVILTYRLLITGRFFERNPIARYFIDGWGIKGMVAYKFLLVAFICVIIQIIHAKRPAIGRLLMYGAIAAVLVVDIYSFRFLLSHGG